MVAADHDYKARIDQAYIDKLDGKISEEFWTERNQDWRREQDQIRIKLQAHQKANTNYLQEGIRILELANQAHSQYVRQNAHEKARLLKILLSNCTLKDGSPCPTYRKPFDLVAESVKTKEWLAFVDDLRTFCFEVSVT
ncbi:MAG: hypothetical protein LLH30_19045 [Candidatus Manganitrophus sp. SA1]|nr:hypothetical protein [Candidatus Manganitrophus morganii]